MERQPCLPADFTRHLPIRNAPERFAEAEEVARRLLAAGVPLLPNPDHAAIFTQPPSLVAGPLKALGYVSGWDCRCYPSPVDGCDYLNVPARLPPDSPLRAAGWFEYVAVVHPVDEAAERTMLRHGYGNPFLHHLTWGIEPPAGDPHRPVEYAAILLPFMVEVRRRCAEALGVEPGTLIAAVPEEVLAEPAPLERWLAGLPAEQVQLEAMQGGGFLVQFFCLQGGRIEVACRVGTRQTFNPKSVHKISRDEISTDQG